MTHLQRGHAALPYDRMTSFFETSLRDEGVSDGAIVKSGVQEDFMRRLDLGLMA